MKTWNRGIQSYYIGIPEFEKLYWHKSYGYFLVKVKNKEDEKKTHWELWRNYFLKNSDDYLTGYIPPERLVVFNSIVHFNDAKYWFENSQYNEEV